MSRPTQLRFIRRVLYRLKQAYGLKIDYYRVSENTTDFRTGLQTPTVLKHKITKAIRMPSRAHKDFDYSITYLAANKNFTYGGQFDKNRRMMIIAKRNFPSALIRPEIDDYLIIEGERYDVKEVYELDLKQGFILTIESIEGTPKFLVEAQTDTLTFTETITGVKA